MVKPDRKSSLCISSHLFPRNIIVAGETGVGKSSFINLVVGSDTAHTANDAHGVTKRVDCHPWETDSQTHAFHLWDTPGLGEGLNGSVSSRSARNTLRTLLRGLLQEEGQGDDDDGTRGVHLIVICMRGITRITKSMKETYDIVLSIRDQVCPQIPIVAVITELEKRCDSADMLFSMKSWWTDNAIAFADHNMIFDGYACLTTLTDDCYPPTPGRHGVCQLLARNLLIDHALPLSTFRKSARTIHVPSTPSTGPTRNIVLVGETGAGKSSIINLVTGFDSAVAASDARPVTVGTSYHDWDFLQTQTFRLWDTPGLGQGPLGSAPRKYAHNAVQSLLTELGRSSGVHLLVVCLRGRRVTKITKQTYDTVLALRDRVCPNTPLVAVVTELECASTLPSSTPDDVLGAMDRWWQANADSLSDFHMGFSDHACITTLDDDAYPPVSGRRDDCQRLVRELIIDHALAPRSLPAKDLHVVLFGETGVGKSSLVNLLAGWQVAEVSPDSVKCTLTTTEYQFQLGATTVRLWDTVGLEESEGRTSGVDKEKEKTISSGGGGHLGAIEKAAGLIQRLDASGGISLFLFCMRGSRVTTTMQSNYRLFYEVLGRKQVPIALAVTHLEREEDMEDWWVRNVQMLEWNGIYASGHACITTLDGHSKYATSRNAVQELLWQYADQSKFAMPSDVWLGRLLSGLSVLLGFGLPRGKDLVRVLTKRCHLEPDVARKVAACIENTMDT